MCRVTPKTSPPALRNKHGSHNHGARAASSSPASHGEDRRRSSFHSSLTSSTRSTSSVDSTTSSSVASSESNHGSIPKRVSFSDVVEVVECEPLAAKVAPDEVFYCSDDYRRFRSDSCLEVLDQQLRQERQVAFLKHPLQAIGALCQHMSTSRAIRQAVKQNEPRISLHQQQQEQSKWKPEYPWMTSYYDEPSQAQVQPQAQGPPQDTAASTLNKEREKQLIQELAFV